MKDSVAISAKPQMSEIESMVARRISERAMAKGLRVSVKTMPDRTDVRVTINESDDIAGVCASLIVSVRGE